MGTSRIRIGLLFSTTGPYATIGKAMRNGAALAVQEINADPASPTSIDVLEANPDGRNADYATAANRMLAQNGLTHVVGCYTSSSRKEVLPIFEKYDGLLWYPSHYEGFESNEHVVYTGAAPNQHIIPLAKHMLMNCGKDVYCIGSNYIWAWENNKIMRDSLLSEGGSVLAERYFPVGETDFDAVIDHILRLRPSFVFNTLIGVSAYAFFRAFRMACLARGIDQPREIPVASCSLSEPELIEIGAEACDGHVSSSVYFASLAGPQNRRFVDAYRRYFPLAGPTSADAEASYLAVALLARAVQVAGSVESDAVRAAVAEISMDAPQGRVSVDSTNRHCYLTPRIAVSNKAANFDLIFEEGAPVKPDPYLVHHEVKSQAATGSAAGLRIVK